MVNCSNIQFKWNDEGMTGKIARPSIAKRTFAEVIPSFGHMKIEIENCRVNWQFLRQLHTLQI